MFRITVLNRTSNLVSVEIQGRLDAAAAEAVTAQIEDLGLTAANVALDLSRVSSIEHAGIRLLRALRAGGARLVRCPDAILGLAFDDPGEPDTDADS